jgi:hypothetical protein
LQQSNVIAEQLPLHLFASRRPHEHVQSLDRRHGRLDAQASFLLNLMDIPSDSQMPSRGKSRTLGRQFKSAGIEQFVVGEEHNIVRDLQAVGFSLGQQFRIDLVRPLAAAKLHLPQGIDG